MTTTDNVVQLRPDPTDEVSALTAAERGQLTKAEKVIREAADLQVRADAAYVEVGKAYRAIRLAKLYRASHKTFEVYCSSVWGKKLTSVAKLMDSAQVAEVLKKSEHVPTNARQAHPLVPLMDKPTPTSEPTPESAKQLREIWARILDDAEEGNVKVTAGWIKRWLIERGYAPEPKPQRRGAPMERSPHPGSSIPGNGNGDESSDNYGDEGSPMNGQYSSTAEMMDNEACPADYSYREGMTRLRLECEFLRKSREITHQDRGKLVRLLKKELKYQEERYQEEAIDSEE